MSLTLDPATEQRIQREAALRNLEEPAQLINLALDVLTNEEAWSDEEKSALNDKLDRSLAQIERGEGTPGEQVRAILAQDRKDRAARSQ